MAVDNLIEEDENMNRSIDPERYDPDEPDRCQKCGSWLNGHGDASTTGMHCPECDMLVWVA